MLVRLRQEVVPLSDLDAVDVAALRARRTVKWSTYGTDVLAAWVAEMDFPTAEPVRQALLEAVAREHLGYPLGDAATGLPDAVAAWSAQRYGVTLDPARVHLLPDVLSGVVLAVESFSPAGSGVIVPTPAYMPFLEVPAVAGRPLVEVPLARSGAGYELDLAAIDAALAAGAGTLILCQPYNPVGRLFTRSELLALADVIDRHGARVVSDEIHGPLTFAQHVPYASVSPTAAAHSVTVTSATKAWNFAGLKCAVAITHTDADTVVWQGLSELRTYGATTLGIEASIAAFASGGPWLDHVLGYLDGTRHWLVDALAERLPGIAYTVPEATYFGWLDCRALELPTEAAAYFLEHAGVAVNAGPTFGAPGDGFVRLNLATSRALLTDILDRMAASLP